MIKNEKQYRISKKRLLELAARIKTVPADTEHDPLRNELLLGSLQYQQVELRKEVKQYEKRKQNNTTRLPGRQLKQLPSLIVEYKLAMGLTQKTLAGKLGIKEQQWQRYEADNFSSISFKNLLRLLDLMELDIHLAPTPVQVPAKAGV
jgi:ribosome-binding protein aMBF1 (putative translation factor)